MIRVQPEASPESGPSRRRLTAAECRKRSALCLCGAMLAAASAAMASTLVGTIPFACAGIFFLLTAIPWLRLLSRLRGGEAVELLTLAPGERIAKAVSVSIAMGHTTVAGLWTVASYMVMCSPHVPLTMILLVALTNAFIWCFTFHVWKRLFKDYGPIGPTVVAPTATHSPTVPPTPRSEPGLPSSGHWWTQNALRDEIPRSASDR